MILFISLGWGSDIDILMPWFSDFESKSHSVLSDSLQPHGLYSPWNSPDQNTGVGSLSLLQGIVPTQVSNQDACIASRFNPYQTQMPALQADLPAEPQGKPKNAGLGSLFLLQQIFPTQELN